jgi:hypothetical protein
MDQTENMERTSVLDSIVNITDNPNHLTLDSMAKNLGNNFILPAQEDNFAKYLTNYNIPTMEFNTDNFDLNISKAAIFLRSGEKNIRLSEGLKSFSNLRKNSENASTNNLISSPSNFLKKQREDEEDCLKRIYEETQSKIEKALIKKNLHKKDSFYKKSICIFLLFRC